MAAPKRIDYFKTFTTDPLGQIFMTGIVNVAPYNTVNLEIIQWPHAPVTMNVTCMMGKITGSTLAEELEQFPLGTAATFTAIDVIGSEFSVVLTGGPPKTKVPIQAWLFLH